MKNCLFSIIIPLYNSIKYVETCLKSIENQSYQNFELIIVDDCSTDGSYQFVNNYLKNSAILRDRYVILRTDKNSGGAGIPRNLGIDHSSGEYLIFVDNDDAITTVALSEICERLSEFPDVDVIHFQKKFTGFNDGRFINSHSWKESYEPNLVNSTRYLTNKELSVSYKFSLFYQFVHAPWSYCYKRDFILNNNIRFLHTAIGEDTWFTFHVLLQTNKILMEPFIIWYVYRQNNDSQSRHFNVSNDVFIQKWILNTFVEELSYYEASFNKLLPKLSEYSKYQFYCFLFKVHFKSLRGKYKNVDALLDDFNSLFKEKLKSINDIKPLLIWLIDVAVCQEII